jgi:hypothetical protein
MKKEEKNHLTKSDVTEQKHSMVCNDQLFFQELRIAAEVAEKESDDELK